LQAFVLTSSPDSFADLQAHTGDIGVIYPTYFQCAIPGGIVEGTPDPEVDAYAAAHKVAELPRFSCQDGAIVHRILTEPRLRARTLAHLVALVAGGDAPVSAEAPAEIGAPTGGVRYAGLDLDLENDAARDRGALSSFVAALAAAADTVFVMAWGIHWERSAPGPIAPLAYVEGVARRLSRLPHARGFVLGVPMYGLDWAAPGGPPHPATALQYSGVIALARSVGSTPVRDSASGEMTFAYTRARVAHHVWYLDAHAITERLGIARRFGLAAGVWRLGEEDQEVWGPPGV
jgi:spore germination protein YaaH